MLEGVGAVIVAESTITKMELRLNKTSKATIDLAAEQGLKVVYSFEYDAPTLPKDITDITEEQLMDLYSKYVSYLDFINTQAWCAKVDAADAEKEVSLEKARKKIMMKEAGQAVAMIDAHVEIDDRYVSLQQVHADLVNYHALVQLLSEKTLKDISFINREISRRISANKATGRLAMFTP